MPMTYRQAAGLGPLFTFSFPVQLLPLSLASAGEQIRVFVDGEETDQWMYFMNTKVLQVQFPDDEVHTVVAFRETRSDRSWVELTGAAPLRRQADLMNYYNQRLFIHQEMAEIEDLADALGFPLAGDAFPPKPTDKYIQKTEDEITPLEIEVLNSPIVRLEKQLEVAFILGDVRTLLSYTPDTPDFGEWTFTEDAEIEVDEIPSGWELEIRRVTRLESMWHQLLDGSRFSSTPINQNNRQLRFLGEESPGFPVLPPDHPLNNTIFPRGMNWLQYVDGGNRFFFGHMPWAGDSDVVVYVNNIPLDPGDWFFDWINWEIVIPGGVNPGDNVTFGPGGDPDAGLDLPVFTEWNFLNQEDPPSEDEEEDPEPDSPLLFGHYVSVGGGQCPWTTSAGPVNEWDFWVVDDTDFSLFAVGSSDIPSFVCSTVSIKKVGIAKFVNDNQLIGHPDNLPDNLLVRYRVDVDEISTHVDSAISVVVLSVLYEEDGQLKTGTLDWTRETHDITEEGLQPVREVSWDKNDIHQSLVDWWDFVSNPISVMVQVFIHINATEEVSGPAVESTLQGELDFIEVVGGEVDETILLATYAGPLNTELGGTTLAYRHLRYKTSNDPDPFADGLAFFWRIPEMTTVNGSPAILNDWSIDSDRYWGFKLDLLGTGSPIGHPDNLPDEFTLRSQVDITLITNTWLQGSLNRSFGIVYRDTDGEIQFTRSGLAGLRNHSSPDTIGGVMPEQTDTYLKADWIAALTSLWDSVPNPISCALVFYCIPDHNMFVKSEARWNTLTLELVDETS